MSLSSLFSSVFSVVHADAPEDKDVKEPAPEDEAQEEPQAEEEEEEEPEDVRRSLAAPPVHGLARG